MPLPLTLFCPEPLQSFLWLFQGEPFHRVLAFKQSDCELDDYDDDDDKGITRFHHHTWKLRTNN